MQDPQQNGPTQHNPHKKAGTTMMILAWVAVLGLLIMYFAQVEEEAYNPNQNPESLQDSNINTVILQRNRYDHYVTKGAINRTKVTFLLDTGASDVVIPEHIAMGLGLSRGAPQRASTANGIITVYQTRLPELSIGSITLYNVEASINPAMKNDEILLGMSALRDIEFTQRGEQLTLKQYR